jgi:hypothetical protein
LEFKGLNALSLRDGHYYRFCLEEFWAQFLNHFTLFHGPRKYAILKYEILMAVTLEITGFLDLAPYILVENDVSEPRIFFVIAVHRVGD